MDRQIVYAGSIPLDTDLLYVQRNVQTALGALARAVLGDGVLADGMACTPGSGAYSVVVGPGSYTALVPSDWSPFGSLPADATPVMRTALQVGSSTLQLGAPGLPGQVLRWLVQCSITEVDGGPVALPYWNAGNPGVAFSGPGNSGLAQNTQRQTRVVLGVKSTAVEDPANPAVPQPDPNFAGLFVVTTYAGKPQVEAADIVEYADAPRLRFKLPALPAGFSVQEAHSADTVWQAPDGVRLVRVRVVGGGGGGGGGDTSFSGGGGGAGGYAEAIVPVEPRQAYAVAVGAAGTGGGPGGTGGQGGSSSFGGTLVAASGGMGGGSKNPNSFGGTPGNGTFGTLQQSGGFGTDGAVVANVPAGNGGASVFGGGGRGSSGGGPPANGTASGSGGGGGYGAASAGGVGQVGVVILEY